MVCLRVSSWLIASAAAVTAGEGVPPGLLDDAVAYVARQAARTNDLHPNRSCYPDRVFSPSSPERTGTEGPARWKEAHAPGSWTSGFWPGVNWQLSALNPAGTWADTAKRFNEGLKPTQYNNRTHDVGFMVYYSFGLGYRADPMLRPAYGPIIFNTALSLAERFNPKVGCTMSWGPGKHCNAQSANKDTECDFTVIIDNMMNLEILLFAALEVATGDCGGCTQADRDRLVAIAEAHANTAARNHIRADGSIHHIVCYDPTTGARRFACNGGGRLDNTTWARGQAWALYGFTMMHRYTKKPSYLGFATRLADFFVGRLRDGFPDHVPNFDLVYDLGPLSNLSYRDASAAAIASSGLIELAGAVGSNGPGATYLGAGADMVTALVTAYKTDYDAQEGAVLHCDAADCDVPWADYYLLEAIGRFKGRPDDRASIGGGSNGANTAAAAAAAMAVCGDCWCVVNASANERCPAAPQNYSAAAVAGFKMAATTSALSLVGDCNPYKDRNCSTSPPITGGGVCAIKYASCGNYSMLTFASAAAADAAGHRVTHDGACGLCSTLEDLASYISVTDMTKAGKKCGVEALLSLELGMKCFRGLGMTPQCARIWAYDAISDASGCAAICLKDLSQPYNIPPTCKLNDCLQCDEDEAGPLFKRFAGRTRRRSGLISAIQRPCSSVANVTQPVCG